ncbi:MAG: HRDC domain-containing protein, partial [Burkholderiales bacterium]
VAPADAGLLQALKAWRRDEARSQGVPAYVILHDSTLAEIARARPRDLATLAGLGGIGAKKLERYGDALLQVIN